MNSKTEQMKSFALPTEPAAFMPSLVERFNSGKLSAMMELYDDRVDLHNCSEADRRAHIPMATLRDLRMHQAAQLLKYSCLGVDQVSRQSGYESRTSFTRAFKETFDQFPTEYRAGFVNKQFNVYNRA